MKYGLPILLSALWISACSDAGPAGPEAPSDIVADAPDAVSDQAVGLPPSLDADGKVLITVDRLIPEDAACLVMIDVVNGTDEAVTAGLFAFNVTGNGEQAGANMFPQTAEPDTIQTAQIVLPGADCDNALTIEGGQLNCRIAGTEDSCLEVTELRDGVVDFADND